MTYALAQRICRFMVAHGATRTGDADAVTFGLFHILSTALHIALLAIPSLILGCVPPVALYTIFFTSLKKHAGGSHAARHWVCLTGFTALAFGTWLLCSLVPAAWAGPLGALASLGALGLVLARAPVPHPGNPKSPRKLKKLRRLSILIATLQAAAVLVYVPLVPGGASWLLCGAVGGFTAAFTLLLPMPAGQPAQRNERR